MKLILFVGPDTLAIKAKSKKAVRKSLERAMKKRKVRKTQNGGHLGWKFKGREYTYGELKYATVQTLEEFFKSNEV